MANDDDGKVTRIRRGKGKEAGTDEEGPVAHVATKYTKAPEVATLADKLIPSPGLGLGHLAQAKIAFVFSSAKQLGCAGFGSASLWPAAMRPFGRYDFRLLVSRVQWDTNDERVKAAAIAHLLAHCEQSERGVYTIARHDYEDFSRVAKRYGAWYEGARQVAQQLRLIDDERDAFAATEARANGEQQAAD